MKLRKLILAFAERTVPIPVRGEKPSEDELQARLRRALRSRSLQVQTEFRAGTTGYVDLFVWDDGADPCSALVEVKVADASRGIGQLHLYRTAFDTDPALVLAVRADAVTKNLRQACQRTGVILWKLLPLVESELEPEKKRSVADRWAEEDESRLRCEQLACEDLKHEFVSLTEAAKLFNLTREQMVDRAKVYSIGLVRLGAGGAILNAREFHAWYESTTKPRRRT